MIHVTWIGAVLVLAFAAWVWWTLRNAARRLAGRRAHDDRDVACRFWWGLPTGTARCPVCNPAPDPVTPFTPRQESKP